MAKKLTDRVSWVGKVDWELKTFHGDEYSTHRGSSYNSYLVRDEKTVLIDTVWKPYDEEFISNLSKEIDLQSIDYVVANHAEVDHSGALPELMRLIPNTPIYCTANAVKSLTGHYHQDWNFVTVKTGDTLDLGSEKLIFIEAPMLHWPDSMFCYLTGENVLFSNDAFGQHLASENLYNNAVDTAELYAEAIKYYANILTPFSARVTKKINEILALGLPVDMICPSHGVIWKDDPLQIVHTYLKWADSYAENQISIVYDSMWGATRLMAEAIAKGITSEDADVTVKLMNAALMDKNDILTEVFRSKTVLVGSSTINNGILHSIAGLLEMIKGFKFKGKSAAAFGSFGWSGESVVLVNKLLEESGFEVLNEGIKKQWRPDDEALLECETYGRSIISG